MRHLTIAEKSLLIGDDVADALLQYAAHIGRLRTADDVSVRAFGIDGNEVEATLLLNSGTVLASETTQSELPEPDNAALVAYITAQLAQFDLKA